MLETADNLDGCLVVDDLTARCIKVRLALAVGARAKSEVEIVGPRLTGGDKRIDGLC